MCVDGVWWIVLPNLPEMEEAAENPEEEKDLKLRMEIRNSQIFQTKIVFFHLGTSYLKT